MIMKFYSKNVYGRTQVYPACDLSREFLNIQGLKVFTPQAIQLCKLLNIGLEQVLEKVELWV